jgi:hypothetical protein
VRGEGRQGEEVRNRREIGKERTRDGRKEGRTEGEEWVYAIF